jgi:small subunit ribosomal protein S18
MNHSHKPVREKLIVDETNIDYKNIVLLRKVISNYAKILPAKRIGVSAKIQRKLSQAIKRARYMALLQYTRR